MSDKLTILIKNFNSYCVTLSTFISTISPNETMKMYKDEVVKLDKKQSTVIIDTFVLNALKYESQILEGNEAFFLGESFEEITNDDENMILKVFEFKNIWRKVNNSNKTQIKNYMKILCRIARAYVDIVIDQRDQD